MFNSGVVPGVEGLLSDDNLVLKFHSHIAWPTEVTSGACSVDLCVGQIVFADYDLSGELDLIVPMCFDTLCKTSKMFLRVVKVQLL